MPTDFDPSRAGTITDPADQAGHAAEVARIQTLLEKGPLAEAEEVCKQALARFPQAEDLLVLKADIERKEAGVRDMLEKAEGYLKARDFQSASELFTEASRLLPLDRELAEHIVGLLHEHAQTVIEKDWRAAKVAVDLASSIQPGSVASPFLADALERHASKGSAKMPRARLAAIIVAVWVAIVVAAVLAWNSYAAHRFGRSKHPLDITNVTPAEIGTLAIRSNIQGADIFIDDRKYAAAAGADPLRVKLPNGSYQVRAVHKGYTDYGPITTAVTKGGETAVDLELFPKPALVRIRGAEPGTQVKLDGVLVAAVGRDANLEGQLSTGRHVVELARAGYIAKKITLELGPGEAALLSGAAVQLESTDASLRSPIPSTADLHKDEPNASQAYADVVPKDDWDALDKSSGTALADFVSKYPDSPHANEAGRLVADLESLRADESAWRAVNLNERSSIEYYMTEFPSGRYRGEAAERLADLRSAELLRAETAAILAQIHRFSRAWNAKDLDAILAIQRDLNRQALRSQFSAVKTIAMKILPVSEPQIAGTQATLVCRRQADETYSDGSVRRNPESMVTYLLSKRDGNWVIDGTR